MVVHVSEEHENWYTQERHSTLVSLLAEVVGDLLKEARDLDRKKGDLVRVKEDVFRGAQMELRCFVRNTQPLYHVLVPSVPAQGGLQISSADTTSAHTLYVTASPHA